MKMEIDGLYSLYGDFRKVPSGGMTMGLGLS